MPMAHAISKREGRDLLGPIADTASLSSASLGRTNRELPLDASAQFQRGCHLLHDERAEARIVRHW